jgi:hypothetical protein
LGAQSLTKACSLPRRREFLFEERGDWGRRRRQTSQIFIVPFAWLFFSEVCNVRTNVS